MQFLRLTQGDKVICGKFRQSFIKNTIGCSALLAATLLTSLNAEDSGWILGANLGGSFATNATFYDDSGTVMLGTGISVGIKTGYQAFITNASGIRFYLSGIYAFGIYPDEVNQAQSDLPIVIDSWVLADLNADYLFNWKAKDNWSVGLFIGFFSGALVGLPLEKPNNPNASTSFGITTGLNLGLRSVVNFKHQFEFGIKGGVALFLADVTDQQGANHGINSVGALVHVGAGYNYKF